MTRAATIAATIRSAQERAAELTAKADALHAAAWADSSADDGDDWLAAVLAAPAGDVRFDDAAGLRSQADRLNAAVAPLVAELRQACRCGRCGGNGRLDAYAHIANGVCFECGGTGWGVAYFEHSDIL